MRKYKILSILFLILFGNGWTQAQTIAMRVPDSTMVAGNSIDLPIYADNNIDGLNVMSYLIQLTFDPSYLQPISANVASTLSAPFGNPTVNNLVSGKITIAGYGISPLSGKGKFITIRFKALKSGSVSLSFSGASYNYFNEGTPIMSYKNGTISITATPAITVSPNTGTLTIGGQQQFTVSGGAAPFQWEITNPDVANINASGLLTGVQTGFTKVVAQDKNGIRDTSNLIEIRAMRLSIPSNLSHLQGTDMDVPVNVTDLSGLNINSGNFTLSFNQNILTPIGIVQTGTLLASYPAPEFNISTFGVFSLVFYGTTPLSGSGTLIYIRFHVSSQNTGTSQLTFSNGLFNEDLLPVFTNGTFTVTNLPTLTISPNTGNLVAGETLQLKVNGGGTAPFEWSVTNADAADISQSGLLTVKKSGAVKVTVEDSSGATAISGAFQIYDTRITLPDTITCPDSPTYYYPIQINALPAGQSILSMQGTVTYNATYLTLEDIETTGTLTEGWTFTQNPSAGQLVFVGYGTSPFSTGGTIFKLKFTVKSSFIKGSSANINLNNVILNEGAPLPLVDINGNITGSGPAAAGTITGATTVAQGQEGVSYSVPTITGATGYVWTLPTGATIATGSNTNSITVNFSNTATQGALKVYGKNNCANGTERSLAITVNSFKSQDIVLNTGWNIISANVVPANLEMKAIFQTLIDAGSLKKVMDEAGKTIENFGAFGGWKNNIGNFNSAKGYKVNVTALSTLSLEGTPIQLPMNLSLNTGWNIISYPCTASQDGKAIVQALIDSGKLKKVMDEGGKTIENFGAFGGWKNNIGNFLPGRGYKVNVLENCILTIPVPVNK